MLQNLSIGILGVWLFISGFLGYSFSGNMYNYLIVGILSAVLSLSILSDESKKGWVGGFVGMWLIITAFIPTLTTGIGNIINAVVCGIILMVIGFMPFIKKSELSRE